MVGSPGRWLAGPVTVPVPPVHPPAAPGAPRTTPRGRDLAVVGGSVLRMTPGWAGEREPVTVLVRGGVVAAVGPDVAVPDGVPVLDATGCWVLPGFVEAHTHLGVHAEGEGWHGADVNEKGEPRGARLRALDAVDPADPGFADALAGGVTTAVVMPGSANVVGGQTAALKTWGRTVLDMLVRAPLGVKSALGENPRKAGNPGPGTRMGVAAALRDSFAAAQALTARRAERLAAGQEVLPATGADRDAEVLARVLAGELLWHQHAHRADDLVTAVRLAEEFGYRLLLQHVTEGHLVAGFLAEHGAAAVVGPLLTSRSKAELRGRTPAVPAALAAAGVPLALTTDHPVVPVQHLALSAAVAVREGLDRDEALRALTSSPARLLGLDDRVGSLAPGLDGDLVLWSGDPMDVTSRVLTTVLEGRVVLHRDRGAPHAAPVVTDRGDGRLTGPTGLAGPAG